MSIKGLPTMCITSTKTFPYYCSKGKPFTFWEVERAVKRYYKNIKEFDSIDRENVKFVIEAYRQLNPEHSYPKVDLFRATYQSMQHQQSIRKEQNGNYHNT
jgi:hypothetical protein